MSTNPISAAKLLFYSAGKKITNLSRLFKTFLIIDLDYNGPVTTLIGHIILTIFAFCFQGMELTSYPNSASSGDGIAVWLHFYCNVLLLFSTHTRNEFFHKKCGPKLYSIANIVCLFLGILFEKYYKESMASLYAAFSFAVFFLILLILLRPSTDLGFFGFILGAIGSISYNLFAFSARFWISIAVCFLLFCFKEWLDKNWIEEYKAGDTAISYIVDLNEISKPYKFAYSSSDHTLADCTSSFEINRYVRETNGYLKNNVVYPLKCWLTRIEEVRLKANSGVGDVAPLETMTDEESQILVIVNEFLMLTNPEENQRVREFDCSDPEAVVAMICFLIFYLEKWIEMDGELLRVMPRIATTNLDEGQLELLRITNNVRLQWAMHSAIAMRLAMQLQAWVNGCLIWRIGAFRIRGEVFTRTFINYFSLASVVVFMYFVLSFILFFPQFKLNLVHGRYLRRPRS